MLDICVSDLDKVVLEHKKKRLTKKLEDYFMSLEMTTVDVPEFMKPIEQRRTSLVPSIINDWEQQGLIDEKYFRLLEDEDNGR